MRVLQGPASPSGNTAGRQGSLRISSAELQRRREFLFCEVQALGGDAFVTFSAVSSSYLANYGFPASERPAALVLTTKGRSHLFIPELSRFRAESDAEVDHIETYPDYPGELHPMARLAGWLQGLGLARSALVAESAGYASAQGYFGPALAEVLPDAKVSVHNRLVERLRRIKSLEEIAILRHCYHWAHVAHEHLQRRCRPGARELDISSEASRVATEEAIEGISKSFSVRRPFRAYANFGSGGGQVGVDSANHYCEHPNPILKPGDVLLTFAAMHIAGYCSELERTMVVGQPSREQERMFGHMLELQDAALDAIRPGVTCAAVDAKVRRLFDERSLWPFWHHHTGHSIGLLGHEAPFLDVGDDTVIEPGMVFTVEPGLYAPNLGGFRHSDTVLVTETGTEPLTHYPRDLASLVCG